MREIDASILSPCVYFLISLGRVVYVGQTTDLRTRIGAHRRDKLFDRVFFFPVPPGELDETERRFIRQFRPRYNFSQTRAETSRAAKEAARRSIEAGIFYEQLTVPPELALVIEAWATLPDAVRAGIVAMVRAASGRAKG